MKLDSILSIVTIVISIIILSFTIYPYCKKKIIKKILYILNSFYIEYEELNPYIKEFFYCAHDEITYTLFKQSILYYCIPRFRQFLVNFNKYDILKIELIKWLDVLYNWELWNFYKNLKLLYKKLKIVNQTIEKYKYIDKNNLFINDYNFYNDKIEKTSISFCPDFDNTKLFGITSKINENLNYKKFIKELKSDYFCININFKKIYSNQKQINLAYSIYFKNKKIINFEPWFLVNYDIGIENIIEENEQEIENHLKSIIDLFGIKSNSELIEKIFSMGRLKETKLYNKIIE